MDEEPPLLARTSPSQVRWRGAPGRVWHVAREASSHRTGGSRSRGVRRRPQPGSSFRQGDLGNRRQVICMAGDALGRASLGQPVPSLSGKQDFAPHKAANPSDTGTRVDHVHVDLVGPFMPDRGFKHLLTVVDRTTRWPDAIPIADMMAETILQAFLDHWVSRFGVPSTVTSDQGAQFTSDAWKKALGRLGINGHDLVSPAGKQRGGEVSSIPKKCPSMRGAHQYIVDAIAALGFARHPERPKAWHGNVYGGSRLRCSALNTRPLLLSRAVATDSSRAVGALEGQRGGFLASDAGSAALQGVALHREGTSDGGWCVSQGRPVREARPRAKVHWPVQDTGKGLEQQHLPFGSRQEGGHGIAVAIKGGCHADGNNVTPLLGRRNVASH